MPRRVQYDEFLPSKEPRWLKHFDVHSRELSTRRIEPQTDLRQVFQAEEDRLRAEGWTIEENGAKGRFALFFYNRDGERRHVLMTTAEVPLAPHSA